MTSHGSAYVITEELVNDVFIAQINLNHALHGDEVKVHLFARRKNRTMEGEVEEILKRARITFVGTVQISKNFAFLDPESKNMPYDIFIPLTKLKGALEGQKAIASITEWPDNAKNPIGEIVEVLGFPGDNEVEMHSILSEFQLPYKFPEQINNLANKISEKILDEEIALRRDFRGITTFTIDPEDAKDFDDALSIRKLDNHQWEVGVHIADVTHYVKPDTVIDKEGLLRATSVYLVDRCVPMLPERLSNFICSLRPDEDKLTFSVVCNIDIHGNISDTWFGKTIIRSIRRFSYEQVQTVIENRAGELVDEILTLDTMAKALRKKRFDDGAIAFDRVEVKFHVDEKGKPLDVFFKQSKDSNQLIEEFMLLANRKVAELIGNQPGKQKAKTFVYRIHDEPDLEKIYTLTNFIRRFGYKIKSSSPREIAMSLNTLLDQIEGKPEQDIIEQLAIRSMAKAVYSTQNIGHYGLGYKYYTHFTSPIRRYPDMMVHRLLDHYLQGGKSVLAKTYEQRCKHSSDREQRAAQAERASVKYKQVEFMKDKLGQVFEGIISGLTDWGIYVEIIENKVEGMITLKDLTDDYYVFDDKNFCIVGQRTHQKYNLGQHVNIQVARVNLLKKQLDFVFYEK
jgi:ribonuclease R